MNMGKLFFMSLIILSLVMGHNWWKNRPKATKRVKKPPKVVNVEDLEIGIPGASGTPSPGELASSTETASGSEGVAAADPDNPDGSPEQTATAPAPVVASAPVVVEGDQVLAAFKRLPRSPFELSPFGAMLSAVGKSSTTTGNHEEEEEEAPARKVTVLQAPFSGTFQTPREMVAILENRLVRTGEMFNEKVIKKIEKAVITLEDASGTYYIPKNGWLVQVATDGSPVLTDSLKAN